MDKPKSVKKAVQLLYCAMGLEIFTVTVLYLVYPQHVPPLNALAQGLLFAFLFLCGLNRQNECKAFP
jgi:hypothetical protein